MKATKRILRGLILMGIVAFIFTTTTTSVSATPTASSNRPDGTYIVVFDPQVGFDVRTLSSKGHTIKYDFSQASVVIVETGNPDALARISGISGIAFDNNRVQTPYEGTQILKSSQIATMQAYNTARQQSGCASTEASCPLQWDLDRIRVPQAWKKSMGDSGIRVAVLDSGITSTHEAFGTNYDIASSASFVEPNESCELDDDTYQSLEDFTGHGTWTAAHIAGVNGTYMTGIAPETALINVRVLGACGFGFESWVLAGMLYAHQAGAQVVSMSLGGYMCGLGVVSGSTFCSTEEQVGDGPVVYQAYSQVVRYLKEHGTIVVASAGNDHVRIDRRGMVTNKASILGSATTTGIPVYGADPTNSLYGLTVAPAGIPGVIAVSATNRINDPAGKNETLFGQPGKGKKDQLAYYSNYGERIDVAAPGGARNYNIPRFDCLVIECERLGPSDPEATDHGGDFGAWGVDESGSSCDDCYQFVQGTSMAAPKVAAVAALYLATHPKFPVSLLPVQLKLLVTDYQDQNKTPESASNPSKPTYNYDLDYSASGIPGRLIGTGVIDAAKAVR